MFLSSENYFYFTNPRRQFQPQAFLRISKIENVIIQFCSLSENEKHKRRKATEKEVRKNLPKRKKLSTKRANMKSRKQDRIPNQSLYFE